MELKLDLHIHSNHSPDSYNTVQEIESKIRDQGFQGYALTNHNTLDGLEEATGAEDLVVIPGMEVSAQWFHVLVYDPVEVIPMGLSLPETVDLAHDQGSLAVLAHPYGLLRSWLFMNQVEEAGFDALEVDNSAQLPYELICWLNQRLANKLSLPVTGGSDSHILETVGRSHTVVDAESMDKDSVIKAIKLGRTRVGGSQRVFGEWFSKNILKRLG